MPGGIYLGVFLEGEAEALLDRVVSIEPGKGGAGLKAVSAADCPGPEGSPTAPALPGALVLHGLCALAELVLEDSGGALPVLEGVEEAEFLRSVGPGEVLTYRIGLLESGPEGALLQAEATVRGEEVARARLRYRRVASTGDALDDSWRRLRRTRLSGQDPPLIR